MSWQKSPVYENEQAIEPVNFISNITRSIDCRYVLPSIRKPMRALFCQAGRLTYRRWTGRQAERPSNQAEQTEMEFEQLCY